MSETQQKFHSIKVDTGIYEIEVSVEPFGNEGEMRGSIYLFDGSAWCGHTAEYLEAQQMRAIGEACIKAAEFLESQSIGCIPPRKVSE